MTLYERANDPAFRRFADARVGMQRALASWIRTSRPPVGAVADEVTATLRTAVELAMTTVLSELAPGPGHEVPRGGVPPET